MSRRWSGLAAFVAGAGFGGGLLLSGMTQPPKVIAFLDVGGEWDPSLACVMLGAIVAYVPLYRLVLRRPTPLLAARRMVPQRSDLDGGLVVGAGLFGVGWGLAGYCPGPAVTAMGAASTSAWIFGAAMLAGMALQGALRRPPGY